MALDTAFLKNVIGLRQDTAGNWLCSGGCGAVLVDPNVFSCASCARRAEAQRARDEHLRRAQEWRARIEEFGSLPGVPVWPAARSQIHGKLLLAASDLYRLEDGPMLLLGPSGSGKTSAVVSLLRRIAAAEVARVLALGFGSRPSALLFQLRGLAWITGQQLAKARRQARMGTGEAPTVERACVAPILVLDELGFENAPDDVVFEVVDTRYAATPARPTLVTSGRTRTAFQRRYGDATWRRLTERGSVISEWTETDEKADAELSKDKTG